MSHIPEITFRVIDSKKRACLVDTPINLDTAWLEYENRHEFCVAFLTADVHEPEDDVEDWHFLQAVWIARNMGLTPFVDTKQITYDEDYCQSHVYLCTTKNNRIKTRQRCCIHRFALPKHEAYQDTSGLAPTLLKKIYDDDDGKDQMDH